MKHKSLLSLVALVILLQSPAKTSAKKNLLLIGGAASFCSSAAMDGCDSQDIDWKKVAQDSGFPANITIKSEDLLQLTGASIKGLQSLSGYPSWAIKDLQKLDSKKQYTLTQFKDQMRAIDSHFLNDISDDNWQATQDYLAVIQTEVVSYDHSPVYSKDLYGKFVEISGGSNAVIGIVSASSQDDKDTFEFYEQGLKLAGAKETVWIPIDVAVRKARQNNDCDNLDKYEGSEQGTYDSARRYPELTAAQIKACKDPSSVIDTLNRVTGIFFCGGDQSKHKLAFMTAQAKDTDEMALIRQRVNSGEVAVSGTSAGTAVQGGIYQTLKIPMIAGGESYQSLVDQPLDYLCNQTSCQDDLQYDITGGLALFQSGVIDTHFSQRGRQGRIVRLAALRNDNFAIGVDETTGILIQDDSSQTSFEVIGEYGVSVFDLTNAKQGSGKSFSISGVTYSYFTDGDKFSISSQGLLSATASSKKNKVSERGYSQTTTDIFSSPNRMAEAQDNRDNYMEFVVIASSLIDSTDSTTWGETYETNPSIYRVNFKKTSQTKGYKGNTVYGDERYCIQNLSFDLGPKSREEEEQQQQPLFLAE